MIRSYITLSGWHSLLDLESRLLILTQVKRIHEYKRQLLNIMGIVYRYKKMKEMSPEVRQRSFVPRVCIFGGKAFATYVQAKRIVKFIADVGATVNNDSETGDLLKVLMITPPTSNTLL